MPTLKRLALAVPVAAAALLLGSCGTTATHQQAPTHRTPGTHAPATKVVPAPKAAPAALTVPTDLVGSTLGDAKARLAELGFTHVVVAGGTVTDDDKVVAVPEAGKSMSENAQVVVVGRPSVPPPTSGPSPASSLPAPSGNQGAGGSSAGSGPQLTCDLNAPVKTDPANPNLIINRACGYTGSDGRQHSHDPWIEGQLVYDRCLSSGGTWDIPSQSCKH